MKLTYFGTAAAEGFPALFCACDYCKEARALGGKNVRTRSQSLIGDDLLIDFPPDAYYHFLKNGVEGDKIKYLLLTHSHRDHLYASDLYSRHAPYAHGMSVPTLRVLCSSVTASKIDPVPENVEITVLEPFKSVTVGEYEITPLPARHMKGAEPFIYIIRADKTLLYAHDTGYFFDDVFDYLEKNKIVFDMVSLDCTNVDIPISDEGSHMGFPNIERVLARLGAIGALGDSCIKYVNHFSHNGNPLHARLEKRAAEYGCFASYDGCRVDF